MIACIFAWLHRRHLRREGEIVSLLNIILGKEGGFHFHIWEELGVKRSVLTKLVKIKYRT